MEMVQKVYGPDMRDRVDTATMERAGLFAGMLTLGALALVWSNFRRQSRDHAETDQVGKELLAQVELVIDELYAWSKKNLSKLVSR